MRHSPYERLSKYLQKLNDQELTALLKQGVVVHAGIGGTAVKIEIEGTWLFVKQVPLNMLESRPENIQSTANVFGLPVYYQYGVGSGGFSVWREVLAHGLSTAWVLADENQNFPLLYHWRILDDLQIKEPFNEAEWQAYVTYWEGSTAIGARVRANQQATASVVLCIEYIPDTLQNWLSQQATQGTAAVDKAIAMVARNLLETTAFINTRGMLHFDAHFRNILTDGERLYFSDFGLVTSSTFALSNAERQFLQHHHNYDRCFVVQQLTNWIITYVFGKERLEQALHAYVQDRIYLDEPATLTPLLASLIERYAAITLKMNAFHEMLVHKTKRAHYPAAELEQLWHDLIR